MSTDETVPDRRRDLMGRIFPDGVPRLWCPPLTHFRAAGKPDAERIRRHLAQMAPHARGILVPGSTGEGWEMTDEDIRGLLSIVLDAAAENVVHVLVGVLKTEIDAVLECIESTAAWLRSRGVAGVGDLPGVVGFTVCPPKGAGLSQDQIRAALASVLEPGYPTALYQLPQVTENEMAPETVQELAAEFPNFYLFKDTSGEDRVAKAGLDLGGVFLVRGAEGNYAGWTGAAGGPYDGFLLSTANVFAHELNRILELLAAGRPGQARELSDRLEAVVNPCFEMVADFPAGNPFTNANKALDQVMAYGSHALDREPPILYSGVRLPRRFVERAVHLLHQQGLQPHKGYMS
jgi:dihydrodipicolinate synthase/N-acetylneuraminate lyase